MVGAWNNQPSPARTPGSRPASASARSHAGDTPSRRAIAISGRSCVVIPTSWWAGGAKYAAHDQWVYRASARGRCSGGM